MKWLAAVLVIANALLWVWWQGFLGPLWEAPGQGDREPSRLLRQIKPEAVSVLTPGARPASNGRPPAAAASAAPAASAPPGGPGVR